MSVQWEELLQPIAEESPCGVSLEDTALLASFDAARIFGRLEPFDAPPPKDQRAPWTPPDWGRFKATALEALAMSKDLRLLANLGAAVLRTDGIPAFLKTLPIASHWLERYWAEAYPRLDDGDAMVRRSALNCFADSMAVVDGLRRLPLVKSRQHGTFSLRDAHLASGQAHPREGEAKPDQAQIAAAFGGLTTEELEALQGDVVSAVVAVRAIEAQMRSQAGADGVPNLDTLSAVLSQIELLVRAHVAARAPGPQEGGTSPSAVGEAAQLGSQTIGGITSRHDAIRALDAVAEYFRRNEPSSPIPLFVERAKRLVSKSFLEVLADVVPDAVGQARTAGGVPEDR